MISTQKSRLGLHSDGLFGRWTGHSDATNKAGYTPRLEELDANGQTIPWYKTPAGQQFASGLTLTQNLAAAFAGKSSAPLVIDTFNTAASNLQDSFPDLAASLGGTADVLGDLTVWNSFAQAISKGDALSIAQSGNAVARLVIGAYQKTLLNQIGTIYGGIDAATVYSKLNKPDSPVAKALLEQAEGVQSMLNTTTHLNTHKTIANYSINTGARHYFGRVNATGRDQARRCTHTWMRLRTRTCASVRASGSTGVSASMRKSECSRRCAGRLGRGTSQHSKHDVVHITHESIANYSIYTGARG
jgi:hypothetical protein